MGSDICKAVAVAEGERLWKTFRLSRPADLILEDIALARGVMVIEGPLDGMEARLVRRGNKGLIRVREGIPEAGRRRFAIAHELGHWELHGKKSQLFACTGADMAPSYATSPLEVEANYFAAGLLMPSFLFSQELEGHNFSFATLSMQANVFGTSLTATAIRHVELSKEYVAVIASRDGRIQWWRGSSSFAEVFHICRGNELSSRTVARGVSGCSGTAASPAAEEVDIDAWSERNDTDGCRTFVEESIYMERYGQTMTLLHLP